MFFDTQFIYIILLAIVEIFGDFSLLQYTKTWSLIDLGKGIGFYGGVIFFLIKSLVGSQILYVNGLWDGISCLLESIASYVFLGERFSNPCQYLGLIFIIGGIFLIKMKD